MHLVSFSVADSNVPRPGVLLPQSGTVIDLGPAYDDTLAVIAAGVTAIDNPGALSRATSSRKSACTRRSRTLRASSPSV